MGGWAVMGNHSHVLYITVTTTAPLLHFLFFISYSSHLTLSVLGVIGHSSKKIFTQHRTSTSS